MFCPSCGLEERNTNQFCRACGANLTIVRSALESPDSITASAVSARNEISRAFAQRICETDAYELKKVAEDVLPQLEKFLESPEERSLRWVRTGSTVSFIGLGVTIAFMLAGIFMKNDMFFMSALGLVTFFIGLSFIVNGKFHTIPQKNLADNSPDGKRQLELDKATTNELISPQPANLFSSVTETTTRNLQEKQPVSKN
jgi:hypothetical protein